MLYAIRCYHDEETSLAPGLQNWTPSSWPSSPSGRTHHENRTGSARWCGCSRPPRRRRGAWTIHRWCLTAPTPRPRSSCSDSTLLNGLAEALGATRDLGALVAIRRPAKAFDRAIALANTSAEAAHIRMHLDRLIRDSQPLGAKASKK